MARVKISYFAWVREGMGCDGETVDLPVAVATIVDLIDWLAARDPAFAAVFADRSRVRGACDGAMVSLDSAIGDASEIALFPPVTGG
jgi:sulfur-carrier protein